ncbi:MAG: hypothetical protein KDE03_08955 [Rhodobacteraceae bacterium]|nr:hypothetical protein [Paracoccaceae bacterium]
MDRKPPKSRSEKDEGSREARLKAALKANLSRRKAQAKARGAKPGGADKES